MDNSFESGFPVLNRRKSLKKARMSLFQDDDGVFEEFPPLTIFTPGKYEHISDIERITPVVKKRLSPLVMDEDSGLGMDVDLNMDTSFKTNAFKRENNHAPKKNHISECLYDTPTTTHLLSKLKRPLGLLLNDGSGSGYKRQKRTAITQPRNNTKLNKALSFGDKPKNLDTAIENVLDRIVDESDLISDGSRTYRLPTVKGKHHDLKNISPETMADVLCGKYDDVITSYKIIDCRYPYEFDGGHIKGAENLYTQEKIAELLSNETLTHKGKPDILIFHCEFSSERGPKMSRFLRNKDRELNSDNYPTLHYPEIYLLSGGYKEFFHTFKNWCEPMEYKPMLHDDHADDLRHFRSKSKSWTAGERRGNRSHRLRF